MPPERSGSSGLQRKLLPALLASLLLAGAGDADDFSKLIVFGDSLTDTGNLYAATSSQLPPTPYFEGRFSDGPVFVEVLAGMLDLVPPVASGQGGTNYAWGGALAGVDIDLGVLVIPSVRSQVAQFLESVEEDADATALYMVSGGGNDIIDAVTSGRDASSSESAMREAATHHAQAIGALHDRGALHFLVVVAPDISLTPGYWQSATANRLAGTYNETLIAALESMEVATMRRFDLASVILGGEDLPTVMDAPCFAPPDLCADPDNFFFFDDIHPSAVGHQLLAAQMLRVLREPTALLAVSWSQVKEAVLGRFRTVE